MRRVLVAGFGNELRGDDAFGIRVLEALQARESELGCVELLHVGTGGLRLAQELLAGYDGLVVVDAMHRDGPPGTLYVLEVEQVTTATLVDLHLATPAPALSVAKALDALPERVWMVGCEPNGVDELTGHKQ
jgi:hydrogenase maturation protease